MSCVWKDFKWKLRIHATQIVLHSVWPGSMQVQLEWTRLLWLYHVFCTIWCMRILKKVPFRVRTIFLKSQKLVYQHTRGMFVFFASRRKIQTFHVFRGPTWKVSCAPVVCPDGKHFRQFGRWRLIKKASNNWIRAEAKLKIMPRSSNAVSRVQVFCVQILLFLLLYLCTHFGYCTYLGVIRNIDRSIPYANDHAIYRSLQVLELGLMHNFTIMLNVMPKETATSDCDLRSNFRDVSRES